MKKWKIDIENEHCPYFLRDEPSKKNWFVGCVFVMSYDIYVKKDTLSKCYPNYSVAKLNFAFEI